MFPFVRAGARRCRLTGYIFEYAAKNGGAAARAALPLYRSPTGRSIVKYMEDRPKVPAAHPPLWYDSLGRSLWAGVLREQFTSDSERTAAIEPHG